MAIEDDLTIRATIDATGTQSGAAQAAAAFQQMRAAQDDVAASAIKATAAQEAQAAGMASSVASVRAAAAAHRELAAAMDVRPGGIAFGTLESAGNRLAQVYSQASVEATGFATAATAAVVPQTTLRAVTDDLASSIATTGVNAAGVGVALGDAAAVSSATFAAVSRDLAKTQTVTEQASHGISTAMEAAFVAPPALRSLGTQVQQQATMAERATHGITTAMNAAFLTPPALKTLGSDIVGTLARSGEEVERTLAGKVVAAANEAGLALGGTSARVKPLTSALKEAEEGAVALNFATAGATREFIVLGHEAMFGNFSRIPGSMVVLAERTGGLQTIFQYLTLANVAMGVAAIAAAGGLAYLIYQLHEEKTALEEISGSAFLTGQTTPADINFDAIRENIKRLKDEYGATTTEARGVIQAFAEVTSVTNAQKQALVALAVAQAHLNHGDAVKIAAEEAKAIQGGAVAFAKYAQEKGAITEAEKTDILTHNNEADALQMLVDRFNQVRDAGAGAWDRLDVAAKKFLNTVESIAVAVIGAEGLGDPFAMKAMEKALGVVERPPRPGEAPATGMMKPTEGGLNPEFRSALDKMIADANAQGIQIGIGSSFRSSEKQQQLYDADVASHGGRASGMVAPPGHSMHEKGLAADLTGPSGELLRSGPAADWVRANAATYGLNVPMQGGAGHVNEPWHVEPAGIRAGIADLQRESPQSAATTKAIEDGNKKFEEREQLQTKLNTVTAAYNATQTQINAAIEAGDEGKQKTLIAENLVQASAMRNLQLRIDGVHTEEEADRHRTDIARLNSETEAAQRVNDQAKLQKLAQERAEEDQRYAGTSAAARAEAERVVQKAKEVASKDALDITLGNIRKEEAEQKGAQARLDAIAKERAAYAAQGLQNTPQARQLDVSQAQAERQLIDENYQEFAAKERLKIQELKGEPKAIAAVYDDWLNQLKNVYSQDEREYARVQREKVKATQQATQDSLDSEMRGVNTIVQVRNSELGLLKAQLGAEVTARQISKSQEASAVLRATDDMAHEEERLYQAVADRADATQKVKEAAYLKIMEIAARAAEREEQESKRVADQIKRDADQSARAYVSLFDSAANSAERFLTSTQPLNTSLAQLAQSLGSDVLKAGISGLSQFTAHQISPNLEAGKGLSDLLGHGISTMFGGGPKDESQDALKEAARASAEQLKIATQAQQKLNELLGVSQTATAASTLAKTSETAATGSTTIAKGVETTATTAGVVAKGAETTAAGANAAAMATDTAAVGANAAAQGTGAASSGAGGILQALPIIGGITSLFGFEGGGLVPSAAGGMVVPGTGGGQMAILHPNEMVLPAPLSRGIQGMVNDYSSRGGDTNVQADVRQTNTYNAGGNAGAFRTSDAERFFRQNGQRLAGDFRRAVAGGFRP